MLCYVYLTFAVQSQNQKACVGGWGVLSLSAHCGPLQGGSAKCVLECAWGEGVKKAEKLRAHLMYAH